MTRAIRSGRHGTARHSDPRSVADTRTQTSRAKGRSEVKDKRLLDATEYYSVATCQGWR